MCKSQAVYEITVEGYLDRRYWAAWFDGLTVTLLPDGTTRLSGPVRDQAALHGVLGKVRDLGLPLVAVQSVTRTANPLQHLEKSLPCGS